LLDGEKVENFSLGILLCVGAVQLIDSDAIDGKLGPQTSATTTTTTTSDTR